MASSTSDNLPTSIVVLDEQSGEQIVKTLSAECDEQASYLLTDPNFITLRQESSTFCRLKTQNALAGCCNDFSYELGMFYDCQDNCVADCTLEGIDSLCNWYGGRSCQAQFMPTSGNPSKHVPVTVVESVCIPQACDNNNDRDILFQLPVGGKNQNNPLDPMIYYYPTHLENFSYKCESGTGTVIGVLITVLLSAVLLGLYHFINLPIWAFVYLFMVPKSKNKNKALEKAMNQVFGEDAKNVKPTGQGPSKQGTDVRVDVKASASIDSGPHQSDSQDHHNAVTNK